MLNVSVADRNRFFNSWVVSKRDVNDKLIKVAFTGFTGRRPLVFTHVVTFSPVYKSPVCTRQSTPFLSACIIITRIGECAHLRSLYRTGFVTTSAGRFKVCWLAAFIPGRLLSPPFFLFFYLLLFKFFLSLLHIF